MHFYFERHTGRWLVENDGSEELGKAEKAIQKQVKNPVEGRDISLVFSLLFNM